MQKNEWQEKHLKVINEFVSYLNKRTSDYILKGGTSLMLCYNLDRFSEDIDLDAVRNTKSIGKYVTDFCTEKNYMLRIAKETDTVKRYMVDYDNENKPLKIEISYRQRNIDKTTYTKINGITVYTIDELCQKKSMAYVSRDKIRDLYDLCFICNNYWNNLSNSSINILKNAVEYKGIEQFDYIIKTQKDELINEDKLTDDFLKMYDKLGLLFTEEEKQTIDNSQNDKSVNFIDKVKEIAEWANEVNKKAGLEAKNRKKNNHEER